MVRDKYRNRCTYKSFADAICGRQILAHFSVIFVPKCHATIMEAFDRGHIKWVISCFNLIKVINQTSRSTQHVVVAQLGRALVSWPYLNELNIEPNLYAASKYIFPLYAYKRISSFISLIGFHFVNPMERNPTCVFYTSISISVPGWKHNSDHLVHFFTYEYGYTRQAYLAWAIFWDARMQSTMQINIFDHPRHFNTPSCSNSIRSFVSTSCNGGKHFT